MILVSKQSTSMGQEYPVDADDVTVGRDESNDLVLDNPGVSRYHARLQRTTAGYVLEDLDSRNGTWVNDQRVVGPAVLADGDIVRFGEAVFAFRVPQAATRTLAAPVAQRETITIMFADLVGHTALFESLGSETVYRLLDDHLNAMSTQVTRHGGRTVKTEGDGLIASFSGVRQAVDCAVDIQRSIRSLGTSSGRPTTPVRIGINSGEALRQGDDLVGLAVVKAARVMGEAGGGAIYVSQVSRQLLAPTKDLRIRSLGWHELKGISRRERLFEVVWQ